MQISTGVVPDSRAEIVGVYSEQKGASGACSILLRLLVQLSVISVTSPSLRDAHGQLEREFSALHFKSLDVVGDGEREFLAPSADRRRASGVDHRLQGRQCIAVGTMLAALAIRSCVVPLTIDHWPHGDLASCSSAFCSGSRRGIYLVPWTHGPTPRVTSTIT